MASRALSVGTILGPGGMAGAIGGMFIARFAGWTLDATGSYVPPLLLFAGVAYLVTLGIIHLLTPRLEPAGLPAGSQDFPPLVKPELTLDAVSIPQSSFSPSAARIPGSQSPVSRS